MLAQLGKGRSLVLEWASVLRVLVQPPEILQGADNPIGQWNTFRIKMIGEKVTIWLNGELVVDNVVLENYWERDKPIYPTGQIELQNHGNTLYFKNVYLREIPRKE